MKILAMDVTAIDGYIILIVDSVSTVVRLGVEKKSGEFLLTEIDNLLNAHNLKIKDMDCLVAVSGPGSFTGIRVGLATLKAFVFGLNKKAIVKNVFEILEDTVKNGVIVLPCTKTTCYFGIIKNSKMESCGVFENTNVSQFGNKKLYTVLDDTNTLNFDNLQYIPHYETILTNKIINCVNKNEFTELKDIAPFYIQLSQAERSIIDTKKDV